MKQLIAYITAGFPNASMSVDVALALKESGVDILELGIPFSDPVADGPTIELANLKTLQRGFKLEELFQITKQVSFEIPTLWMGYFNPFYHRGMDYFIGRAHESGCSGFLIPDLPREESGGYKELVENAGLSFIDFIAPTHSKERIQNIAKASNRFIYLVAYAGITGRGTAEDLMPTINYIKEVTDTPVYVGFGVDEKTAREKVKGADGVIVGSAFVKVLLDESLTGSQKVSKIALLARKIKEEINA